MKNLSFHNRIMLWFGFATLILSCNAVAIYQSFRQFNHHVYWVNHTYEVIERLENIVSELTNVQSAQRGYVITGHEDYLAPYQVALPRIEEGFSDLKQLLADNKEQSAKLDLVRKDVDSRLHTAETIINAYKIKGPAEAAALVKAGTGKREMEGIRALVSEMVNVERNFLIVRQTNLTQSAAITLRIGTVGLFIFAAMLASVFWLIYRETQRRETTERSLHNTLAEMQIRNDGDRKIGTMINYLQSCQDMPEAYDILGKMMPQILPGTGGAIFVYNNSRNFVEPVLTWGETETVMGEFLPDDCWALRLGQAHLTQFGDASPVCGHIMSKPENGTTLCFPMQAQGEALGLFYVFAPTLDDLQQALVRKMGEQISLALSSLKLQSKLKIQSTRDPMTGLFNRRYLEETMEREFSRARRNNQPVSVLVLDIDHFKKYNDTMGHDAGDALLIKFAQLIQENARKEDIVCRYGGEEFVIVLPTTPVDMAEKIAEKICAATRQMKISVNKSEIGSVTVSIGIATFPLHADKPADLINQADSALYAAKHGGRNQARVAPDPSADISAAG